MDRALKPLWQMQNSSKAMILTDAAGKIRIAPESAASELVVKVENGAAASLTEDERKSWILE
ncbi:hypothetical protein ABMC88_14010 [Sulfitobacter sp. HNIBRBA2951]|uniref:hypothetical protein n=1 Tax=Sulfitobacter aquimarinus TaxID=3158557 RepID=UPI0032DE32E5